MMRAKAENRVKLPHLRAFGGVCPRWIPTLAYDGCEEVEK